MVVGGGRCNKNYTSTWTSAEFFHYSDNHSDTEVCFFQGRVGLGSISINSTVCECTVAMVREEDVCVCVCVCVCVLCGLCLTEGCGGFAAPFKAARHKW